MSDELKAKSNINLSDIQKLLSTSDHRKWRRGIKRWVIDNNCDVLKPAAIGPGPAINQPQEIRDAYDVRAAKNAKDIAAWEHRQLQGVNCIGMTCGLRGEDLIEDCTEVATALALLDEEFKPEGDATYAEINTRWSALCLAACKNVDEYVNEFDEIYSELKVHNTLTRLNQIQKFLDGLGPAFDSWLETFSVMFNITDATVTLSAVQKRVQVQEQHLLKHRPTAFTAYAKNSNSHPQASHQQHQQHQPRRDNRWCGRCNSDKHWEKRCWILHPEQEAQWRREFPERAAAKDERDARNSGRKDFRKHTRAQNARSNRACSTPPASDAKREKSPPSSRQQYAGMAIESTTV